MSEDKITILIILLGRQQTNSSFFSVQQNLKCDYY